MTPFAEATQRIQRAAAYRWSIRRAHPDTATDPALRAWELYRYNLNPRRHERILDEWLTRAWEKTL